MKRHIATIALACAAILGASAIANAQTRFQYDRYNAYSQRWYDYDRMQSRRDPAPSERAGAGNFGNLPGPQGGVGRVDSHTQN